MKILIKNARIVNASELYKEGKWDVLAENGIIKRIAKSISEEADKTMDASGKYLLPGMTDIAVHGGEPGYEHRETVISLLNAAAAGGFTRIFTHPNLNPATHSVSEVEYLRKKSSGHVCTLLPIGALSHDCKGQDISEMLDLKDAGVTVFSDGLFPVQHGGLLLRALLYIKSFDGLVLNQPLDATVFPKGHLHEGLVSTQIGVRGVPQIAETIMLQRDLELLEYTQSRLHALSISCRKSVDLIRAAKLKGLAVTASVPIWNLIFTDEELLHFDSMFKLNPPLRSEDDRQALIEGVKDGTIDCISSGHRPLDTEQKELEFPYATSGAISLQTGWSLAIEYLEASLGLEQLVKAWSYNAAKVMNLDPPVIQEGNEVDFILFDPRQVWTFGQQSNLSKSRNSPLWSKNLKGRVVMTAHKEKIMYF